MAPRPNRTEDLARPRSRNGTPKAYDVTKLADDGHRPDIPPIEPDDAWHPVARLAWDAYLASPLVQLSATTDYFALYLLCVTIDDYMSGSFGRYGAGKADGRRPGRSAIALAEINRMMSNLLYTESDRLRVHIELERDDDDGERAVRALVAQQMREIEAGTNAS